MCHLTKVVSASCGRVTVGHDCYPACPSQSSWCQDRATEPTCEVSDAVTQPRDDGLTRCQHAAHRHVSMHTRKSTSLLCCTLFL
jgi:hypothetical protein